MKGIEASPRAGWVARLLIAAMAAGVFHSAAPAGWDAVGGRATGRTVLYSTRTMGTYAGVTLVTRDSLAGAATARFAHLAFVRVDSLLSNWTQTSEVARLNREAPRRAVRVEREAATVIEYALRVWRESGGAFDVTVEPLVRLWGFLGGRPHVPEQADVAEAFRHVGSDKLRFDARTDTLRFADPATRIDLGGIAKGHAVDVAAESLRAHGVTNALVDISGNMAALGSPPGARRWRIGIRDPRDRLSYFARLHVSNVALATSGKYEQFVAAGGRTYGHILDPRSGRPAEGLISVTVIAPTAMAADAWGTALFVLGPTEARRLAKQRRDLTVVLVVPGTGAADTVWVESDLESDFSLEPAARAMFHVATF